MNRHDDIVVGAGIVGLAHAYHLARAGRRVLLVEANPRATGASVRNFGMVWPIGQPRGSRRELALRSRAHWLDVLREANLWHDVCGSLHVAYAPDELDVLHEFVALEQASMSPDELRVVSADDARSRAPRLRANGLLGALWSASEVCVDPRDVVRSLPGHLERRHGVEFRFGERVLEVDSGYVATDRGRYAALRVWLCVGDQLSGPVYGAFAEAGLVPVKLQMMRSTPLVDGERIGPMLAAGLTLTHYGAFADCRGLPALRARFEQELPFHVANGIHVMVSQHASGALTLGDSHEYGAGFDIFDRAEVDDAVLAYLATYFDTDDLRIAERWHGIYAKHPHEPFITRCPAEGVHAITGFGGAGMTLSFGAAETHIEAAG